MALSFMSQLQEYRRQAEKREQELLHPRAAFSKEHVRREGVEDDHRLPYRRDVDRIVHSKAYARYVDKTQVVYLVANDHITNRGLHVQLVSNFARGIAELLRLNCDLVEAIALGHDVGHPPFGHEGEGYLSQLCVEQGLGSFAHPWQSCRLLSVIEPLNLGLLVYDGFLCHDGGLEGPQLIPRFGKTWEDHLEDRKQKITDPQKNIWPASLEGCLVKICDTVSYLGKDIEDAIHLGIIDRKEVPHTILGNANRTLLTAVACDLIEQSSGKDFIAISDEVYAALATLRKFNFENIYFHPKLKAESKKIQASYRYLFTSLLEDYKKQGMQSYLGKNYLHNKEQAYLENTSALQYVVDYISGMTDSFFVRTLENSLVPRPIEWR